MANKIKYGLCNVHVATCTIGSTGAATYATPVAVPGAVSMSMDAQTEETVFHADNRRYYETKSNNGYSGNITLARLPKNIKTALLGELVDSKGFLIESQDAQPVPFALLFQFEGDVSATRHVLYNCLAGRPSVSGETKGDTIEPQTEELSVSAGSVYNSSLDKWLVKASSDEGTDATSYNSFFSAVYQPAALATP